MNYKKVYDSIIETRLLHEYEGYTERHHIIPKSAGGSDDKDNLVRLSAREHFVCHLLLTKMYPINSIEYICMVKAFMMMLVCSTNQDRHITSRSFALLKQEFARLQSLNQSGGGNSQFGKRWIYNLSLRQSVSIDSSSPTPTGWEDGRVVDFAAFEKSELEKRNKVESALLKNEQLKTRLSEWYQIYKVTGFDGFVELTGYDKSWANIVMLFKRHLPEYVSQNGKPTKFKKRTNPE